MSWVQDLTDELTARGVGGAARRRIVLELSDHIACEPGCETRLGDPRALAGTFAEELATSRTRRSALWAFAALAWTAITLVAAQIAIRHAGGYPGFNHGVSMIVFWPGLLGITIAPQIALAAGTLGAWRTLRRRRAPSLPAAELGLIARRTKVALGAGLATVAGLELYVINFVSRFPAWYEILVAGLAATAGAGLLVAWRAMTSARAVLSTASGPAGDVFDDIPLIDFGWLRGRPWLLGAASSLLVAAGVTAFTGHAEHSLIEGLERGGAEGVAAGIGFVLLGRAIGVFAAAQRTDQPSKEA